MSEINYPALTAELLAGHPVTGAYNADDQLAADELNALNVTRIRASMTGAEIFAATDPAEYAALALPELKSQWLAFCAIGEHNPEVGGLAQQFVVSMFTGGSNTVAALGAARQETISRAVELNLGVAEVTVSHVAHARAQ